MRRARRLLSCVAVLALLLALAGSGLAEVSVELNRGGYGGLLLGSDDSHPWPVWAIVRLHINASLALNADGDGQGDGPAAFAINPTTGQPEVVWAWSDGQDHELALSRWDGAGWTAPELLTANGVEDLDPALAIDAEGVRHISWWRAGSPAQVWYLRLPAGQGGDPEELVSHPVRLGERPGVVRWSGLVRVAYQDEEAGLTHVVVARKDGSSWVREALAETAYQGPLGDGDIDVQVHAAGAWLWVDWVSGAGELAYRVYEPGTSSWSAAAYESYQWDPEAGETEVLAREGARVRIRLQVTH